MIGDWLTAAWGILKEILAALNANKKTDAPQTQPTMTQTPLPPQPAPATKPDVLTTFCLAIQSREGYFAPGENKSYPNGTPAYYNHNPGNLRCIDGNKVNWERRAIDGGLKHNNFCVFPDYATGFLALKEVVEAVCLGESNTYTMQGHKLGYLLPNETCADLTIAQYFVIRDPSSDGNDPASFAAEVASKCGIPMTMHMRLILD